MILVLQIAAGIILAPTIVLVTCSIIGGLGEMMTPKRRYEQAPVYETPEEYERIEQNNANRKRTPLFEGWR